MDKQGEKRLRYAKWKKWTKNQWQQDLNIIEAVWDHLDRERNKRQPTSKEELWDEALRTIPEDDLKKWQKACLRVCAEE